jgi:hypothetical protein
MSAKNDTLQNRRRLLACSFTTAYIVCVTTVRKTITVFIFITVYNFQLNAREMHQNCNYTYMKSTIFWDVTPCGLVEVCKTLQRNAANFYQIKQNHTPHGGSPCSHCHENLKSYMHVTDAAVHTTCSCPTVRCWNKYSNTANENYRKNK